MALTSGRIFTGTSRTCSPGDIDLARLLDRAGDDQRHAADERNGDERAGGKVPNLGFRVFGHRGSPLSNSFNRGQVPMPTFASEVVI